MFEIHDHDPYGYIPIKTGQIKPSNPGMTVLPSYGDHRDKTFHFDDGFYLYRNEKIRVRGENIGKYYQTLNLVNKSDIYEHIITTLITEYPEYFRFVNNLLLCKLTGESLFFAGMREFDQSKSKIDTYVQDGFDALSLQVQEDLTIHSILQDGSDLAETISLHIPNGWTAEGRIGKSFRFIHEDVKNSRGQLVITNPEKMVKGMVNNPKTVERVGALTFRSNSVLHSPPNGDSTRGWDPSNPSLFLRFERQTLRGMPLISSFFFTVKTYMIKVDRDAYTRDLVVAAIESAGPDVYDRNFIQNHGTEVVNWLKSLTF